MSATNMSLSDRGNSAMDNHEKNAHAMDISALGRAPTTRRMEDEEIALHVEHLDLFYAQKQALFGINLQIPRKAVTAFIGPSGCGKSTLLRCFNRMNDLVDGCRIEGQILLDGGNIFDKGVDVTDLRRRVGM